MLMYFVLLLFSFKNTRFNHNMFRFTVVRKFEIHYSCLMFERLYYLNIAKRICDLQKEIAATVFRFFKLLVSLYFTSLQASAITTKIKKRGKYLPY